MRIHYINMKNYRQYRDARIAFSTDPKRNFTVIEGANGAGKSNLLNAITWCLYGEERHLREEDHESQLPIVNEKVYHGLSTGETAAVEVEIALGEREIEYIISRKAQVYRRLDDEIAVREDTDPRVMYRIQGNWRQSEQPTYAINSLLPADISHFFFFDGEQLDKFFQEDSTDQVRKGIIDVSQIELLNRAIDHLGKVRTKIRKAADGISPEIDRINADIDEIDSGLEKCRRKLERLHRDRDGLQANLEEIREKLRHSSIDEVRDLQKERDRLRDDIKDYETQLDHLRESAGELLTKLGPRVYAYSALETALERIEEQVEHGELPPKVRAPFFRDLLEQERCICGRDLAKDADARTVIEQHLHDFSSREYPEDVLEGKFEIQDLLRDTPHLVQQQRDIGKQIRNYDEAVEVANKQLKEISQKIEKLGEIDPEEVSLLEQQHRQFEEKQQKVNRQIGRVQVEREESEREYDRLNRELERALEADKRRKDLFKRFELCSEALATLNKIRTELISEVRERIEQKTEEYFLDLIWKKGTYKRVQISDEYEINVLNVRDMPALGTLSAGERQVLALAFMAALGTISGFDAPVVIDTPIGRISGEPRKNIAESLPNYLAHTQVTLLMTDTEYTEDVQVRLHTRVGREYKLEFREEDSMTEVIAR